MQSAETEFSLFEQSVARANTANGPAVRPYHFNHKQNPYFPAFLLSLFDFAGFLIRA